MKNAQIIWILLVVLVLSSGTALSQESARDDEYLIRGLMRDGLYDVAAEKIFDFVFRYPGHATTHQMLFSIGESLYKQDKFRSAIPLFRCYLQEFSDSAHSRKSTRLLAESLFKCGEYPEAEPMLRNIISFPAYQTAERLDAKQYLGQILVSQGKWEQARQLIEEESPTGSGPRLQLLLAKSYIGLNQFANAENLLKGLVNRRRKDDIWHEARQTRVQLCVAMSRYQEIIDSLEDFSVPEDEIPDADMRDLLQALAVSHYHLGNFQEAYEALQPLRLDGGAVGEDVSVNLPSLLASLGEWESAANMYKDAASLSHDFAMNKMRYTAMRKIYRWAGARDEEANVIWNLVQFAGDAEEKAHLLITAANLVSDTRKCVQFLKQALESSNQTSTQIAILHKLGDHYLSAGEFNLAREHYQELVNLGAVGDVLAQSQLAIGKIYQRTGNEALAINAYRAASEAAVDRYLFNDSMQALLAYQDGEKLIKETTRFLDSTDLPGIKQLAAVAHRLSDEEQTRAVRQIVDTILLQQPENEAALLGMSLNERAMGNTTFAAAFLEVLASSDQEALRGRALAALILLARSEGNHEEIIRWCELARQDGDTFVAQWARFVQAEVLEEMGDVTESRRVYREIVLSNGQFAFRSLEKLQTIAKSAGNYSAAFQSDPVVADSEPSRLIARDRRLSSAISAARGGEYARAVQLYGEVVSIRTLDQIHRYFYGKSLYETGSYNESLEVLDSVDMTELLPAWNRDRLKIVGSVQVGKKDYQAALSTFRQLLTMSRPEDSPGVMYLAAGAADLLGETVVADEYYSEYLEIIEPDELPREHAIFIADRIIGRGQHARAVELYAGLAEKAGTSDQYATLAMKAAETEAHYNPGAAAERYLAIAYRYSGTGNWPAIARLAAARIFLGQGNRPLAERQFRYVAENYPASEEGRQAAAELRRLAATQDELQEETLQSPEEIY